MSAPITRTVRRLLDEQQTKNTAQELSACVRALDYAERRQAANRDIALPLARAIIALDTVGKALRSFRPRHGEPVDAFQVQEHAELTRIVAEKTRWFLTHHGDPDYVRLGELAWARATVKRADAAKAVATARAAARAAQPKPATRAGGRKRAVLTVRRLTRKSAEGRPMIMATASSDATDLDREFFTHTALGQMAKGLRGKLIFLNHKYGVPEDVFGKVESTVLEKRGGTEFLDLSIAVETANPRAVQAYDMVKAGTRLGVSVGVLVNSGGAKDMPDGRRALSDVTPLEASIVGIPSNQTAWTTGAKGRGASLTAALS